jgi:RND superfamily putative drug exporter
MRTFARFVVTRPKSVLTAWLLLLVALGLAAGLLKPAFSTAVSLPSSESATGFALLERSFPGTSPTGALVFIHPAGIDTPAVRSAMEEMFSALATEGISVSSPYDPRFAPGQVSPDRTVAFAQLGTDPSLDQGELSKLGTTIISLRPVLDGLVVEVSGAAFAEFHPPESEALGLAFAIIILIFSLGSVLAMGLSVLSALMGVAIGTSLVITVSHLIPIPDFATSLGTMLGLAVGIDYALFLVARFREFRATGLGTRESVLESLDSSGRAVLFAGITVVLSLLGMLLMGLKFISGLGLAAAITVTLSLAASLTLLPALLVLASSRVENTRKSGVLASALAALALVGVAFSIELLYLGLPAALIAASFGRFLPGLRTPISPRPQPVLNETFSYRWSRQVQARPIRYAALALAVMLALTLPTLSLRLGFSDEGNFTPDTTTRRAYDLLSDGFGPGFNGPLILVGNLPAEPQVLTDLTTALSTDPQVAFVTPSMIDPTNSAFRMLVIPKTSPQDERTVELVGRLRDEIIPSALPAGGVYVTGPTAASIDFTSYLAARLWLFIASVLTVSFLLLLVIFRSLLVPLKAVAMNLCSIAAAYGVVVAIFQWGWFANLLGVAPAPIEPFVPMMMFAILFGLSMDYEVFLLSRIKEEYSRTNDPTASVADGLAASARVITAAAAIMVVVFGGFLLEDVRVVKLFGVGLSVAVLLDATIIRLILVPATMELLGSKNWYLPRFLDRLLPDVNIEGSVSHHRDPKPGSSPTPPPGA